MDNLRLSRPIVILDLETTGRAPQTDRIVEFAGVRVDPSRARTSLVLRVNPGMPIPAEATRVHGISDADVASSPRFDAVAPSVAEFLDGADLGGFNICRFDLPMLECEMSRAGVPFSRQGRALLDAQILYHRMEPRDLSAAHRFFCGGDFSGAHSALADVEATLRVLDAQLGRYAELPREAVALHNWLHPPDPSRIDDDGKLIWNGGEVTINFGGAHRGKSLKKLAIESPDYLRWILAKDFSEEVKRIVREALSGRYPEPPAACGAGAPPS